MGRSQDTLGQGSLGLVLSLGLDRFDLFDLEFHQPSLDWQWMLLGCGRQRQRQSHNDVYVIKTTVVVVVFIS